MEDKLIIGGHEFNSRFILGSGKFSLELVNAVIKHGGAEIVTLALRRANKGGEENILDYIPKGVTLLPNTSGARTAEEAVRIARLSRELGCGDFVKVEVVHDSKYLFPDNYETIKATEILAKEGFIVMPYMFPDLNAARDLVNAGAASVMPLGAPIGSNKGLATKDFIKILVDEIDVPIIVDAGIGRPSQACEAMEMGADAVMANTAVATAGDVATMAKAFKLAIEAGRLAYLSKPGRVLPLQVKHQAHLQVSLQTNIKTKEGFLLCLMKQVLWSRFLHFTISMILIHSPQKMYRTLLIKIELIFTITPPCSPLPHFHFSRNG